MKKSFIGLLLVLATCLNSQWKQIELFENLNIIKELRFIDENTGWILNQNKIWKTSNGGTIWLTGKKIFYGDTISGNAKILIKDVNTGYVVFNTLSSYGDSAKKTIDGGNNWSSITPPSATMYGTILGTVDFNILWITYFDGSQIIKRSTNGGLNWLGNYGSYYGNKIFVRSNTEIWAYGASGNIYRSTNSGSSWSGIYIPFINTCTNLFVNSLGIYIVGKSTSQSLYSIYKSTDGGINWINGNVNITEPIYLYINGNVGYCINNNDIIKTIDGGISWENKLIPQGLSITAAYFKNDDLGWIAGVGTSGPELWKTTTGVFVNNNSSEIPYKYKLNQNYPNPFNPSTNIKFDIPKSSFVKLKIFDILGKEIALLIDKKLNAGSYSVGWDASPYPSGVYFYKIESESYTDVKRMMLIK